MTKALLFSLASCVLVACGGSVAASPDDSGASDTGSDTAIAVDTGAPPIVDSGAPSDVAPPGFDAAPGACNEIANVAATVDEVQVPAPLPTLAGGTSIPSGTYVLVKEERYTGAGGSAGTTGSRLQETIVVSPGVVQSVISTNGGPNDATTTTYSIVGGKLRTAPSCGSGTDTSPSIDLSFEVVGPSLRISASIAGVNELVTFQHL